jgi:carbon-monoxide dehydrogenase medium subunit
MFPNDFEYAAPSTVDEAIQLLQANEDAKILAGGHSLLPLMKVRLANPPMLVDIGQIPELRTITANGALTIGAAATYRDVEQSASVQARCPFLVEVVHSIGDKEVRNRGTLGGSLAHADPAADLPAVALALGATLTARGPRGERTIPAEDFFVDMLQTQLDHDEILTAITIPQTSGKAGMAYEKFKHPASGYAVVGVAALVRLDDRGAIAECRVGITGAGPKAQRATLTENMLTGQQPAPAGIAAAAEQAANGLELLGDLAASEEFRAHLVRVHARRALERAVAAAK